MIYPDRATFLEKARSGNLIPVWRELLADMETPVSAYARLLHSYEQPGQKPYAFLLESVEGGEHVARYSFVGVAPRAIFRASGRLVTIEENNGHQQTHADRDPLQELKRYMRRFQPVPDPALPRFFGGAVGYLSYDAIAQMEPRVPLCAHAGVFWPDMVFLIADTLLIFDRVRHTLRIVANAFVENDAAHAYDEAVARIADVIARLAAPAAFPLSDLSLDAPPLPVHSNCTQAEYAGMVRQAQEYIRAGDIFQAVLSQRFEVDYAGSPVQAYRALRSVNPSPYMYCLNLGGQQVVGSSPEIHVRCEDRQAELRPIAGTRPRAQAVAADEALERSLLADPKERAEHIMLVDLARNDLGRVCNYGSVHVPELMVIERYSHVMHIVSSVLGTLDDRFDVYDLMRATFPAGTVSGAPKIRAMEIIAELEKSRRGPYAGAVGYFSFTGNLDSCITIRTALLDGKKAYVQAGAGIVADSDPAREYEETCNKARGLLQALAVAAHFPPAAQGGRP